MIAYSHWKNLADRYIDWNKNYSKVLNDTEAPHFKWFEGGKLNASNLCLDRHLPQRAAQAAIIWEGEDGESRTLTYSQLHKEVCRFANVLREQFGVRKGDRVVVYMPMIPEAYVAMLACARIGAPHVVVFAGFSADVLCERIADVEAKLVITADGMRRKGKDFLLKPIVDEAKTKLGDASFKTIVVRRLITESVGYTNLDYMYDAMMQDTVADFAYEQMDSEDILFILHTSGSTGKPKGIVHTTAGYMLWAQYTLDTVFNVKQGDVFWSTADVGWITGHTYGVYGPLALGMTVVMYEGGLLYPTSARPWQIIQDYGVTQFYTAPTAIRLLKSEGPDEPSQYDLNSLKVLGTVGEPISPEAWRWYSERVGGGTVPVMDTWWQTETGGHMIAPIPHATKSVPGSAGMPLLGVSVAILQPDGSEVEPYEEGALCITEPWPAMFRGVWNDESRYKSYFTEVGGKYAYMTGDGAKCDSDGNITVVGRTDDVINISGHRIGSAEVEAVIASHLHITESAVVGKSDKIKGQVLVAFVVLTHDAEVEADVLRIEVNALLREKIGPIAQLEQVLVSESLPKTRSGKIIRRLLRGELNNQATIQDLSTLEID
jgi:acetyl-CoA synthetase